MGASCCPWPSESQVCPAVDLCIWSMRWFGRIPVALPNILQLVGSGQRKNACLMSGGYFKPGVHHWATGHHFPPHAGDNEGHHKGMNERYESWFWMCFLFGFRCHVHFRFFVHWSYRSFGSTLTIFENILPKDSSTKQLPDLLILDLLYDSSPHRQKTMC